MAALADSRVRPGGILVIEGEPGIGKSRLMLELARIGDAEGCLVLTARASEFERDLPYALFREAIDRHLDEMGERGVQLLGTADPDALVAVTTAMGSPAYLRAERKLIPPCCVRCQRPSPHRW